jgi:hypothetical protein
MTEKEMTKELKEDKLRKKSAFSPLQPYPATLPLIKQTDPASLNRLLGLPPLHHALPDPRFTWKFAQSSKTLNLDLDQFVAIRPSPLRPRIDLENYPQATRKSTLCDEDCDCTKCIIRRHLERKPEMKSGFLELTAEMESGFFEQKPEMKSEIFEHNAEMKFEFFEKKSEIQSKFSEHNAKTKLMFFPRATEKSKKKSAHSSGKCDCAKCILKRSNRQRTKVMHALGISKIPDKESSPAGRKYPNSKLNYYYSCNFCGSFTSAKLKDIRLHLKRKHGDVSVAKRLTTPVRTSNERFERREFQKFQRSFVKEFPPLFDDSDGAEYSDTTSSSPSSC